MSYGSESVRKWRKAHPEEYVRGQRDQGLKRRYGITVEEYEAMYLRQEGKCATCGATRANKAKSGLQVDHNHTTGEVRGLLCQPCNMTLGSARDSVEVLKNMITYLQPETITSEALFYA